MKEFSAILRNKTFKLSSRVSLSVSNLPPFKAMKDCGLLQSDVDSSSDNSETSQSSDPDSDSSVEEFMLRKRGFEFGNSATDSDSDLDAEIEDLQRTPTTHGTGTSKGD